MFIVRIAVALVFFITIFLIPSRVSAESQFTDMAFLNLGVGLEELSYYEFVKESSVWSSAYTGSFVTSLTGTVRRSNVSLSFRGVLSPVALGGTERWVSGGDTVQKNDLSYRLNRATVYLGYVFPGGLEIYGGYRISKAIQKREDFNSATQSLSGLVSTEEIRSQGLVIGLQDILYDDQKKNLIHVYGNLIVIPDIGSLQAKTTNTAVPGVELHSWGLGTELGASYGWTFGEGPGQLMASLQGNFIFLYHNGQIRHDVPGFVFVQWPTNLTLGWGILLQLGGGWFSVME
jgi:hypothetical protein